MWLIWVIIIGVIAAGIYSYYSEKKKREEEALALYRRAQDMLEQNEKSRQKQIERELEKKIESLRNNYVFSAKINQNAFMAGNDQEKDYLLSKYLVDVCEEAIPILTSIFMKAHYDRNYVEEEVAAYLNFCCYAISRASNFSGSEYLALASIQNDKKGRDDNFNFNRRCIYSEINFGEPARAHWDFTGTLLKQNENGLIACLIALADFIWEPCMQDVTTYDEYYNQPITVKSIDAASKFGQVYVEASMQTAIFIETIVSTAQSLNLF